MSKSNQQNRVEMMPDSLTGMSPMSQSLSPPQPDSISELEYAIKLNRCPRAMLNLRKAGKLPKHFLVPTSRGSKQQVRYLLADIDAWELTKQKPKLQK
jgi:hypothetical protein